MAGLIVVYHQTSFYGRELWPYGYGWDSGSEGLGLESHHRMGKIVVLTGKEEKKLKRGPGWPIF